MVSPKCHDNSPRVRQGCLSSSLRCWFTVRFPSKPCTCCVDCPRAPLLQSPTIPHVSREGGGVTTVAHLLTRQHHTVKFESPQPHPLPLPLPPTSSAPSSTTPQSLPLPPANIAVDFTNTAADSAAAATAAASTWQISQLHRPIISHFSTAGSLFLAAPDVWEEKSWIWK